MKLGLVGYPQAGKRTLFRLLTGQEPARGAANEPVPGQARVRDRRFDRLVSLFCPAKESPALLELLLLPDLHPDAAHNAEALRALAEVDAICHLVRVFADDTVFHVAGSVNPGRDVRALAEDLQLVDLLFVDRRQERLAKEQRGKRDDRAAAEAELMVRMRAHLEAGAPLRSFPYTPDEARLVSGYPLLTRKAVIQVLNVDEADLRDPGLVTRIAGACGPDTGEWTAVSARIEEELTHLSPEDRQAFLAELRIADSALDRLTRLGQQSLGLISFFTVGEDEVKAWAVRRGALAPQAGRAIHSDIERGFIRAEVIRFADLDELGSEARVREVGRLLQKGRDYEVADGDVLHFLFKV
jgi:GTP-binding protein YchF